VEAGLKIFVMLRIIRIEALSWKMRTHSWFLKSPPSDIAIAITIDLIFPKPKKA